MENRNVENLKLLKAFQAISENRKSSTGVRTYYKLSKEVFMKNLFESSE